MNEESLRQLGGNNTCLVDRHKKKGQEYMEWVIGLNIENTL